MQENNYRELLFREGLKFTKYRSAILAILDNAERPLTPEEIFLGLKKRHSLIWLSTVYRTLEIFAAKEIVRKTAMAGDRARYELSRNEHRHHLICVGCHKMISFLGCPVENLERSLENELDFDITGHRLEVYGYCQDCKGMKQNETPKKF